MNESPGLCAPISAPRSSVYKLPSALGCRPTIPALGLFLISPAAFNLEHTTAMGPHNGSLCDTDGSVDRPRIPWREAKRSRRLIRTWDSLPSLKVAPSDRPLFSCCRCGYANILVAICPWCLCACVETTTFCARPAPRRRRVSSPSFLSDAQKAQLRRIEQHDRAARSGCLEPSTSMSAHNRGSDLPGGDIPAACDHLRTSSSSPAKNERRRRRQAAVYSVTDVMATVTKNAELEPFVRELLVTQEEAPIPDSPSSPTSSDLAESFDTTIDLMTPDGHHDLSPIMDENKTPLAPMSIAPHPSLRRKHRIAVRQRSSCTLRRRTNVSALTTSPTHRRAELSLPVYPPPPERTNTVRSTKSSVRSTTSTDEVPLGHPQRPLYTAIRKNMFVPPAPTPPAVPDADRASFHGTLRTRPSRSLDIPRPSPAYDFGAAFGFTFAPPGPPETFPVAGCSLSGEAELRMDLARSRSMDGVPTGYQFRAARQGAAVKGRVINFGKGLRDLLLRRS